MVQNNKPELMEIDEIKVKYEGPIEDDFYEPRMPVMRAVIYSTVDEIEKSEITIEDTKLNFSFGSIQSSVVKRTYDCNECSKHFQSSSNLKRHMLVHTKEKPFGCNKCSRHFRSSSKLKRHMLVHTEHRPFECYECSKKFK